MYINRAQFVSYIIHTATLYARSTLLLDAGSRGVSYVSLHPPGLGGGGGREGFLPKKITFVTRASISDLTKVAEDFHD